MTARLPTLANYARASQGRAMFGVGGGGAAQFFDATSGGIDGRVVVIVEGSQTILCDQLGVPQVSALAQFPAATLSRVGSLGRLIQSLFVDVQVQGTLPAGYNVESFRQFLIGCTYVQPEIGGVPQSQIPLAAMIDTRKIDRQFRFNAKLSPGDAQSLAFRWTSDRLTVPLPPSGQYEAKIFLMPVFSAPLKK
jgi:hypothetical protein